MPAQQPFTTLCRLVAQARPTANRADLHLHTTHSDGLYTPAQVVELAVRSGLRAVAITDHDTLEGVAPARVAAAGTRAGATPSSVSWSVMATARNPLRTASSTTWAGV